MLLAATEQEMVVETVPLADVPPPQVDKARPSETVASPVTEAFSESMQVPSDKPQDVASSSGMTLELLILSFADTLALIVLPILLVVLPQSTIDAINTDIVLGPITGPHAIVIEVLLK